MSRSAYRLQLGRWSAEGKRRESVVGPPRRERRQRKPVRRVKASRIPEAPAAVYLVTVDGSGHITYTTRLAP